MSSKPALWVTAKLEDITLHVGRGQAPAYAENDTYFFAIGQRCVRNGRVDVGVARHHQLCMPIQTNNILINGDVCINSTGTGTIGRIGLWHEVSGCTCFADSHVTIVRPDLDQSHPAFLSYLLQGHHFQNYLETFCFTGSTNQIELSRTELLKTAIVQPDVPHQSAIARILSTIDRQIERTEALIAKYQAIKQGMMQDLFTRGVDENGQLRPPRAEAPHLYKETELGWLPKDWEVETIGNLFDMQLGKMLSQAATTGREPYPYLGNKNVQWDQVMLDDLMSMDFVEHERLKYSLQYGDLLICEGGEIGRTAMWRDDMDNCYFQKAIHRLRPKCNKMRPEVMLRFMRYAASAGLYTHLTSQSSIAHLTQEKLAKMLVSTPSNDEQGRIVIAFDSLDALLSLQTEELEKLKKQKQGLMQDLLTGEVPVPESLVQEIVEGMKGGAGV